MYTLWATALWAALRTAEKWAAAQRVRCDTILVMFYLPATVGRFVAEQFGYFGYDPQLFVPAGTTLLVVPDATVDTVFGLLGWSVLVPSAFLLALNLAASIVGIIYGWRIWTGRWTGAVYGKVTASDPAPAPDA